MLDFFSLRDAIMRKDGDQYLYVNRQFVDKKKVKTEDLPLTNCLVKLIVERPRCPRQSKKRTFDEAFPQEEPILDPLA